MASKQELKIFRETIRSAAERNVDINTMFDHDHMLGSCDGDGAFCLVSVFRLKAEVPREFLKKNEKPPKFACISSICMRVHDNIRNHVFHLTLVEEAEKIYKEVIRMQIAACSCLFIPVTYAVSAEVINSCLQRMKDANKIIADSEQRLAVRLYGFKCATGDSPPYTLPTPCPAPSKETLWLMLCRPEYLYWSFNGTLMEKLHLSAGSQPINLAQGMKGVSGVEYTRRCVAAMMRFHAIWHTLNAEPFIASWLLWEAEALGTSNDKKSKERFENNIVVQLMVNKFYDCGVERLVMNFTDVELGEARHGINNFILYMTDYAATRALPHGYYVTADVAQRDTNTSDTSDKGDTEKTRTSDFANDLRHRNSSCAICGTMGRRLKKCGRCMAVVYCSPEHQKLHWKKGHKRECAVPD